MPFDTRAFDVPGCIYAYYCSRALRQIPKRLTADSTGECTTDLIALTHRSCTVHMPIGRPGMAVTALDEMWARYTAGEAIGVIAKALGRPYDTIYWLIASRGGVAPIPHRRAPTALTRDERESISRGIAAGKTWKFKAAKKGDFSYICTYHTTMKGRLVVR